jgi:hypothetical protein
MLVPGVLCRLLVFASLLYSVSCTPTAGAQKDLPETFSFPGLLQILANQPDHTADWTISVRDEKFGINLARHIKIARKQGKARQDFYPLEDAERLKNKTDRGYRLFSIIQPGQPPLVFDPQAKTYTEMASELKGNPFDVDQFVKNSQRLMDKVKLQAGGIVSIDGHEATKVKMTIDGEGEIFFYFARDMKNLLIRIYSGDNQGGAFTVSNISFDVSDDLFQMPGGYKRVTLRAFKSPLDRKAK